MGGNFPHRMPPTQEPKGLQTRPILLVFFSPIPVVYRSLILVLFDLQPTPTHIYLQGPVLALIISYGIWIGN